MSLISCTSLAPPSSSDFRLFRPDRVRGLLLNGLTFIDGLIYHPAHKDHAQNEPPEVYLFNGPARRYPGRRLFRGRTDGREAGKNVQKDFVRIDLFRERP